MTIAYTTLFRDSPRHVSVRLRVIVPLATPRQRRSAKQLWCDYRASLIRG